MADTGHLSVQAIKGIFEQLQTPPYGVATSTPSQKSPRSIRRPRIPFSPIDTSFQSEGGSSLLYTEEGSEVTSSAKLSPEARSRSQSLGSHIQSWTKGGNSSGRKLVRENSFSNRRNEMTNSNNKKYGCNNNNNNSSISFAEMAENIVMNIRNASLKKKEEQQKAMKTKEILTSKFEKDLKNAIERGVRNKWHSKPTRESPFENKLLSEREKIEQPLKPSSQKTHFKVNPVLGVEVYPMRTNGRDEIDFVDGNHPRQLPINKSESNPLCSKSRNNRVREIKDQETSSGLEGNSFNEFPDSEKTHQNISSYKDEENSEMTLNSGLNSGQEFRMNSKDDPVRPPRKRKFKKNKAPLPPNVNRDGTNLEENSYSSLSAPDLQIDSRDETDKSYDDSGIFSPHHELAVRSPSWEQRRVFNYEAHCDRSLEFDSLSIEKENEISTGKPLYSSCSSEELAKQNTESKRSSALQATSLINISTNPLPAGQPPKKPPRTFAHDIYRSLRPELLEGNPNVQLTSSPKMTAQEIESLYTKPLKRLKDKSTFPPPSPRGHSNMNVSAKPAIAPKPVDIINKSKQRFSVVEPLPSAVDSNEFSDSKTPIKRNSSFRFSFKKIAKSSPLPLRKIGFKKETQVGRRIKSATKAWQPKRTDSDKKVRFQSKIKKEVIYNDVAGDPIYAVPTPEVRKRDQKPPGEQTELHYMCSPLFQEPPSGATCPEETKGVAPRHDPQEGEKENLPPAPASPHQEGRDRFRLVDGFKEELRQSCRFVKNRLKKGQGHRGVR